MGLTSVKALDPFQGHPYQKASRGSLLTNENGNKKTKCGGVFALAYQCAKEKKCRTLAAHMRTTLVHLVLPRSELFNDVSYTQNTEPQYREYRRKYYEEGLNFCY